MRCTTYGTPSTAHQLQHAHRYLSGERRRETAERVEDRGAYRVSQDMLMQAPDCELADGNITEAPPRHILRQPAHERRVAERHSTNCTEDLAATMAISRAEDLTSKVVKGGIHLIGRAPVVVHLYREHFFRRYHLAPRTLHLDATGSVTRQVGEKRPYLYALIAESPDTDRSFPLAHLQAESHNVLTIAHFLAQVAHGYKLVTRVPLTSPRVLTDFSWALIHGVSEAIVKTTTEAYLEACWQSLTDRCGAAAVFARFVMTSRDVTARSTNHRPSRPLRGLGQAQFRLSRAPGPDQATPCWVGRARGTFRLSREWPCWRCYSDRVAVVYRDALLVPTRDVAVIISQSACPVQERGRRHISAAPSPPTRHRRTSL